jgi:hypothetical protein
VGEENDEYLLDGLVGLLKAVSSKNLELELRVAPGGTSSPRAVPAFQRRLTNFSQ